MSIGLDSAKKLAFNQDLALKSFYIAKLDKNALVVFVALFFWEEVSRILFEFEIFSVLETQVRRIKRIRNENSEHILRDNLKFFRLFPRFIRGFADFIQFP